MESYGDFFRFPQDRPVHCRLPITVGGELVGTSVRYVLTPTMMPQIDEYDALPAIIRTERALRAKGRLLPFQTVGFPVIRGQIVYGGGYAAYTVYDKKEGAAIRAMLAEIPVGRQRISEKRALTRVGQRLPQEIVDLLHDYVLPVDRRRKY